MTENNDPGPKELPRWARRGLLALLVAVILAGIVLAIRPSPVVVDTATVERGTMQVTVEEDGRTRVRDRYVVSTPVSGHLDRVGLRAGDEVSAGDEVARLRPAPSPLLDARGDAQARVAVEAAEGRLEQAMAREEQAEAALVDARESLRQQEILMEQAGGSRSAVERAEAGVRAREAELRSAASGVRVAERELEQARLAAVYFETGAEGSVPVRAPASGTVLRVLRESEGLIQAGTPVIEVGDPADLELVVDFLSADAVRIRPGAYAEIERWGQEVTLPARVRTVEPSGFTRVSALGIEEQRVNVVLDLEGEAEAREGLQDGYRIEARVVIWEGEDVLIAPASAVIRDGDRWYAFRVDGGRAHLVEVEVGQRSDVEVEVLSGLEEGDEVVVYPGDRVEDGVRVDR